MSNVLIIFQSNTEPLEQMALAVAVGAVEAGGSIRLRRLAAPGAPEVGHQSYGAIGAADLEWAGWVVVGLEHEEPLTEEIGPLLELLNQGSFGGRRGWTFAATGVPGTTTQAQVDVEAALRSAGVAVGLPESQSQLGKDPVDVMKTLGRATGRAT